MRSGNLGLVAAAASARRAAGKGRTGPRRGKDLRHDGDEKPEGAARDREKPLTPEQAARLSHRALRMMVNSPFVRRFQGMRLRFMPHLLVARESFYGMVGAARHAGTTSLLAAQSMPEAAGRRTTGSAVGLPLELLDPELELARLRDDDVES
jgi:hypothetical protein